MATKKAPKKFTEKKDVRSEQQLLIQAAINSNYSLLIPCADCNFLYVRNTVTNDIKHFQSNSIALVTYVKELASLGLSSKIEKDFVDLSIKNNSWSKVLNFLKSNNALESGGL